MKYKKFTLVLNAFVYCVYFLRYFSHKELFVHIYIYSVIIIYTSIYLSTTFLNHTRMKLKSDKALKNDYYEEDIEYTTSEVFQSISWNL